MRVAAACLLALLLTVAGLVLLRSPWGYADQDRTQAATSATPGHPTGTDELGRDRLVRMAAAILLGMAGSIAASALATALSLSLGVSAALAPSWIGKSILYAGDLFLTLPWIFLLMLLRAALPLNLPPLHSAAITFALLAVLGVPAFLRFHYTRTIAFSRSEWLLQGRAAGLRTSQLMRQVVPHLRPLVVAQFLLYVPACIIAEANLGTLGLGIGEPLSSWGSMLQSLQSAAFSSTSRLVYLPLALLVVLLTLLEILASGKETT